MNNLNRILAIAFSITALCIGYAHGSDVLENMTASVGVNAVFDLQVMPASIDFSSVNPGVTTEAKDLTVWCSTNNNRAWCIMLSDSSELTAGSFTIPNSNFHWWGWPSGTGTWYEGTASMNTTPSTIYECGLDEYITPAPVELHLTFNVEVPQNQPAGTYTTTLMITMTE